MHFPDTFTLAPDVDSHVRQLVALEDFAHLRRHTIGCLQTARQLFDRGAACRAVVSVPAQVTAKSFEQQFLKWSYAQLFRPLYNGAVPDFVIVVDAVLWQADTPVAREQLVYHELSHLQPRLDSYNVPQFERSGRHAVHLVPHDVEVFHAELQRYGAIVPAFEETALSIAAGARAPLAKRLKRA